MLIRMSRALMLMLLGAGGPLVLGQGVGAGSPTDTSRMLNQGTNPTPHVWGAIVQPSVSVSLDPQGPAWAMHLLAPTQGIASSDRIVLVEYLSISGSSSWTGWRMDLLTPDLSWNTGQVLVPDPFQVGVCAPPSGYGMAIEGNSMLFTFDSLAPGSVIQVATAMDYTGSSLLHSSIDIRQYPVPEPTSLLAFASVFFIRRRKRS